MKSKLVLLDADSLLYQSVYKCVTLGEIRELYTEHKEKFLVESAILSIAFDRFEKIAFDIFNEIEETYYIDEVEYYFTTCKKNFRKDIDKTYKANRKSNKWVNELKKFIIEKLDNCFYSDIYEADDLIYLKTQVLEDDSYIICGIDKDLRQIKGIHFDYYQVKIKDEFGNYVLNEFEKEVKVRKGFIYVTEEEAELNKYKQLLVGDVSDNVKGITGIGEKKAVKLLSNKTRLSKIKTIITEYKKEHKDEWKQKLRTNIDLLIFI